MPTSCAWHSFLRLLLLHKQMLIHLFFYHHRLKVCEKLEHTISGVNSQLDLEVKANQKLMDGKLSFPLFFIFPC